jgi:TetR/AcrR family transcriptional repressor of bet genes
MESPSNTDARRLQITRGLEVVMAKRGFDGASIADVAAAAGLTAGLVHYHFGNKLEILVALLDGLVARHDADLEAALRKAAGEPERELSAFIDFHLSRKAAAPETLACWITLSGEALRQPAVAAPFEAAIARTVTRLSEILRRGVAARAFECARPRAAAAALVAAIQGYFVLSATARTTIPAGSAARAVKQMARGLCPPVRGAS